MSHHRTQSLSPLQHTSLQMSHTIFFFFRFRSVFYTIRTYVVWKNVQLSHNNIKNDRWWWIDVCVCVSCEWKGVGKYTLKKMLPRISENKIRLFSLFFLFFDYFYIIFFPYHHCSYILTHIWTSYSAVLMYVWKKLTQNFVIMRFMKHITGKSKIRTENHLSVFYLEYCMYVCVCATVR